MLPAYKQLVTAFKWLLTFALVAFLVFKWQHTQEVVSAFKQFPFPSGDNTIRYLLPCFILFFVNWGLEAYKWQRMLLPFSSYSYKQALQATLAGVSLRLITPNQTGDIAGRLLFRGDVSKWKGSSLSIMAYIAQWLVTFLIGIPACILFLGRYDFDLYQMQHKGLWCFVIFALILLFLYFRMNQIQAWIRIKTPLKKWIPESSPSQAVATSMLIFQLTASILRYIVFSYQYMLLLWYFGVSISWQDASIAIPSIFVAQAFLPGFLLIDLGIRGSAALFFIGFFSSSETGILLSAYSIWLINVVLPALVGWLIILRYKLPEA